MQLSRLRARRPGAVDFLPVHIVPGSLNGISANSTSKTIHRFLSRVFAAHICFSNPNACQEEVITLGLFQQGQKPYPDTEQPDDARFTGRGTVPIPAESVRPRRRLPVE